MAEKTPVGKTKSQGWEIGVRRTFPIGTGEAWALLMSQPGLGYWLGHGVKSDFEKGNTYQTDEGTTGDIRSFTPGSLMRMTWQPSNWDFVSTLQIRVQPAKSGATISIHHEKLDDGKRREAMHQHWSDVLDKLGKLIEDK